MADQSRPVGRRPFIGGLTGAVAYTANSQTVANNDLLPSWTEGVSKRTILAFVNHVTERGGPDFVPIQHRVATFDNDGTINRFIDRGPILAFENSDGGMQMLERTAGGKGARLMGLAHHTDGVREWAYDRGSPGGKLDKAWDEAMQRGWLVVDMKRDWKVIYPFGP